MPMTMEILDGYQTAASVAYRLCDCVGVPGAEQVIVLTGSAAGAAMADVGLPAPQEPVEAATAVAKGAEDK
jgi:hypothetical protein